MSSMHPAAAAMQIILGTMRASDTRSDAQLADQMQGVVSFLNDVAGQDLMCTLTEPLDEDALLSSILYACLKHPESPRRAGLYLYAQLLLAHNAAWADLPRH